MSKIVTRIAPSPTGAMHIGTARAALFNYLYARHHGGEFRLRIEDTDKERSTEDSVGTILRGLDLLGLDFDGDVVRQSARADRHVEVAAELLARGAAYRCFMTPAAAADLKALNPGRAFRSHHRDISAVENVDRLNRGEPFVVRLRVPDDGATTFRDLVRGDVSFENKNLDDLVLLRSDGTPTYNLAVVVDDHDMEVSHVIRGDDHIANTPRQILIYRGMGWDVPEFGHIPLILNEAGKKLAKRDGAASVEDFLRDGYLPEAVVNYITRLGWGHGADEVFSLSDAVRWFDVTDVVSSPARLDTAKLRAINHAYMVAADSGLLAAMIIPKMDFAMNDNASRLVEIVALVKEECSTTLDLLSRVEFAIRDDYPRDEKATRLLGAVEARELLATVEPAIAQLMDGSWTTDTTNAIVKGWAERNGVAMKTLGPILRAALTGKTSAPDLGTIMMMLGPLEVKKRLASAARSAP